MWEWRVFFSKKDTPRWNSSIEDYLTKISIETRLDLYINLNSTELGLKIRNYSQNNSILEFKVLHEKQNGMEFWVKEIKIPLQDNTVESIISALRNSNNPEVIQIIDSFSSGKYQSYSLKKHRKQTSLDQISIERTLVQYKNKKWISIEFESPNISYLLQYIREHVSEETQNISYPRFLLTNLE